jgi:hypothetical protein
MVESFWASPGHVDLESEQGRIRAIDKVAMDLNHGHDEIVYFMFDVNVDMDG